MEYFSFFAAMSLLTVEDGLAGVEVRTLWFRTQISTGELY
jgi:hypothetical protein